MCRVRFSPPQPSKYLYCRVREHRLQLVKRSVFDRRNPHFRSSAFQSDKLKGTRAFWAPAQRFLALPLRTADDTAEVRALKPWILVRQHIFLYIAECRLRLALDAVVKGLDDVLFKVL